MAVFLANLKEMDYEENNRQVFEYVLSKNLVFEKEFVDVDTRTGYVWLHHTVEL